MLVRVGFIILNHTIAFEWGLDVQGEKLSANQEEATKFVVDLADYIEKNCYREDSVYNADESRLFAMEDACIKAWVSSSGT